MKLGSLNKSEYYCKCGRYIAFRNGDKYKTPRGVKVLIEKDHITVTCRCGEKTVIK